MVRMLCCHCIVHAEVISGVSPAALQAGLEGRTVEAAKRLGKHLWLELGTHSPALLMHFGG